MKRKDHKLVSAAQFFAKHAGYSYDPKKETEDQGRMRCAESLAIDEYDARDKGFTFLWSVDPDINSGDFSDEKPFYKLWQCAMYNREGRIVNSLHGIDFGRNKEPFGKPYKRVVEAELAGEGMTNEPQ